MLRVEPTCFRRDLKCRRCTGESVRLSSIKKLLQAPKTVTIFRSSDTSLPFFRAASQKSGTWAQSRVGIVFFSRRTSYQHVWFLDHFSDVHLLQHTLVRDASPEGATIRFFLEVEFLPRSSRRHLDCVSVCPWFEDLRTQWCLSCDVPVWFSSEWSRHTWIFDTSSLLNSPSLRKGVNTPFQLSANSCFLSQFQCCPHHLPFSAVRAFLRLVSIPRLLMIIS